LETVASGRNLSFQEMDGVIDQIMQGRCSDQEIVRFLVALSAKGESVEELAGAAAALRKHMTPIRSRHTCLIDTCGTGGDASHTFNISTAAAIVTAAAGTPVAKHGNRSASSRSGSADVLAELGVDILAPVNVVERCLDELGIGFCFAPQLHPSMKNVAAARKQIAAPTVFNLIGPLCNPASAPFQLLGVGRPHLQSRMASALAILQTKRAIVVTGEDGLDEVTLSGATRVIEVSSEGMSNFTWQPHDFALAVSGRESLQIDGPAASAALIRKVLAGESGPPRDIVLANSAAAVWVASSGLSLTECMLRAVEAIDSGDASRLLSRLAVLSHSR
jgi:anthranilate phosphoribosyltransferase